MAVESSYTFDPNESVDARKRRRRIAEQLMAQGMDTSPIQSPWQGAARMAQALMGGLELGMEDKKEREQTAAYNAHNSGVSSTILGGGGGSASPKLTMSPVTQALMPPDEVKAIIDAHVPEADREFAYRMAQKESNFNPTAVSPTGAKGLFQFTGGTWGDVTGQSVGRGSDGRADPVANTKAFVELTRRNREALRGVLGREPTPGELAVAHQQGVGGATALLTGRGTVNPRNLEVQAGNPKNAQDIMRYYGFAPDQGQGGPIQVAQANTGTMNDASGRVQQLYGIATNPMTSPVNKKLALDEIERLRKGSDPVAALAMEKTRLEIEKSRRDLQKPIVEPTTTEREYERAKREGFRGNIFDFKRELAKSGASSVSVNTGDKADGKFDEELAKGQAKLFTDMATEGVAAKADIGQIRILRETLARVPGGFGTGLQAAASSYGIKLGPNADAIEAAQAIISRLVPTQRAPGSGPMSDKDVDLFKSSLPSLLNTPNGNAIILDTMEGMAAYKEKQAEIATAVIDGDMTRKEAMKALRALPDPLAAVKAAAKDLPKSAPKGAPASSSPPPGIDPQVWKYMTPEERALWK